MYRTAMVCITNHAEVPFVRIYIRRPSNENVIKRVVTNKMIHFYTIETHLLSRWHTYELPVSTQD